MRAAERMPRRGRRRVSVVSAWGVNPTRPPCFRHAALPGRLGPLVNHRVSVPCSAVRVHGARRSKNAPLAHCRRRPVRWPGRWRRAARPSGLLDAQLGVADAGASLCECSSVEAAYPPSPPTEKRGFYTCEHFLLAPTAAIQPALFFHSSTSHTATTDTPSLTPPRSARPH